MRVRIRSGYTFHRIMRYRSEDGSIRREKLTETIAGPAVIGPSPR